MKLTLQKTAFIPLAVIVGFFSFFTFAQADYVLEIDTNIANFASTVLNLKYKHSEINAELGVDITRLDFALQDSWIPVDIVFTCISGDNDVVIVTPVDLNESVYVSGPTFLWYSLDISSFSPLCLDYRIDTLVGITYGAYGPGVPYPVSLSAKYIIESNFTVAFRYYSGTDPNAIVPPESFVTPIFINFDVATTTCYGTSTSSTCSHSYSTSTDNVAYQLAFLNSILMVVSLLLVSVFGLNFFLSFRK